LEDVLGLDLGSQNRIHLPQQPGPQSGVVQHQEPADRLFIATAGFSDQDLGISRIGLVWPHVSSSGMTGGMRCGRNIQALPVQ
jgi:hypothetical protein